VTGQFAKHGKGWPDTAPCLPNAFPHVQAANTQARRERKTMAIAATQTTSLVAFTLPGTPYSAQMARFYIRATLGYHDLSDFVEDVEMVTSELVSNAITHAGAPSFGLELMRLEASGAVAVVVTDPCPRPPVKREPSADDGHGRGLHVVEGLSARWGWTAQDPGKAVFAIFTREG
jgi:anti-sigma regulatory factor (Ser/Thr protein kinase)